MNFWIDIYCIATYLVLLSLELCVGPYLGYFLTPCYLSVAYILQAIAPLNKNIMNWGIFSIK